MLAGGRRGRVATAGAGRWRALSEEARRALYGGAMEGLEGEEGKGCGPGAAGGGALDRSRGGQGRRGAADPAAPPEAAAGWSPAAPGEVERVVLRLPLLGRSQPGFAARSLILPPNTPANPFLPFSGLA